MVFTLFLIVFCSLCLFFSFLVCGYYWFLAIVSLSKKKLHESDASVYHSFAILIPAHNEEKNIEKTLISCKQIEYPAERYKIVVIADNCTDNTADIVRSHGLACYERSDSDNKGKGFALAYAFEKLLPKGFEVFMVIDADCTIENNALMVINNHFNQGIKSLQINNAASNPDASPMAYAVAVGNFIENDMFYTGKSNLGLAVFLRGTGMVLHRDLLTRQPWEAYSIVEDVDYSLKLIRQGIKTRFVQNVRVESEFPVVKEQLDVQRMRWADGNIGFGKTMIAKLIIQGFKEKNWMVLDAGWTLLILSRPLVLCQLILTLLLSFFAFVFKSGPLTFSLLIGAIFVLVSQLSYFLFGVMRMGLNRHRLGMLMQTPIVIFRLLWFALKGLLGSGIEKWVRTPR